MRSFNVYVELKITKTIIVHFSEHAQFSQRLQRCWDVAEECGGLRIKRKTTSEVSPYKVTCLRIQTSKPLSENSTYLLCEPDRFRLIRFAFSVRPVQLLFSYVICPFSYVVCPTYQAIFRYYLSLLLITICEPTWSELCLPFHFVVDVEIGKLLNQSYKVHTCWSGRMFVFFLCQIN